MAFIAKCINGGCGREWDIRKTLPSMVCPFCSGHWKVPTPEKRKEQKKD